MTTTTPPGGRNGTASGVEEDKEEVDGTEEGEILPNDFYQENTNNYIKTCSVS